MISGEKVELRGISYKDAPVIYEYVNREDLRDLTGTLYPVSEYEHDNWVKSLASCNEKKIFSLYADNHCKGPIVLKTIDQLTRNAEPFISIGDSSSRGGGDLELMQLIH